MKFNICQQEIKQHYSSYFIIAMVLFISNAHDWLPECLEFGSRACVRILSLHPFVSNLQPILIWKLNDLDRSLTLHYCHIVRLKKNSTLLETVYVIDNLLFTQKTSKYNVALLYKNGICSEISLNIVLKLSFVDYLLSRSHRSICVFMKSCIPIELFINFVSCARLLTFFVCL